MKRLTAFIGIALAAAFARAEVTSGTAWQDVPPDMTLKNVFEQGGALTAETDPSTGLTNDTAYVRGKQVVSAETDPAFTAWKSDTIIALGNGASAEYSSVSLGVDAIAEANSVALGVGAIARYGSVAIGDHAKAGDDNNNYQLGLAYTPENILLNSRGKRVGEEPLPDPIARTLQSYLDERAKRYALVVPTAFSKFSPIAAADATLYAVDADAGGVYLTLPAATADYTQDFALRVGFASGATNTALSVTIPEGMTADYPLGTNAINGTITAPTYFTFTQTSPTKWSITAYAATKEDK